MDMKARVTTSYSAREVATAFCSQNFSRVKLALYADDKILYIENPRLHTKTIKTVNKFSKVAGYKINIWKSVAFLYTNNELSERESFFKKSLLKLHQEKNNILRNKPDQGGVRFTS